MSKSQTTKETKPYWCTDKGSTHRKVLDVKKPKVWYCPGCKTETPIDSKYPKYLCSGCVQQLTDEEGEPIEIRSNGAYPIVVNTKGKQIFTRYVYHLSTEGYWKTYTYCWDKKYGPVAQLSM